MKGFKYCYFILFILISLNFSCSDFIEESVEHTKVTLNAPGDSLETNIYQVQFWWEFIEDATSYRLQVVKPDFQKTESLILDTLLITNKFSYTFEPGKYQWRVRAENASSKGLFSTRNFEVFESSITNQQVQLQSPTSGVLLNNNSIALRWLTIFGATNYRLQIDTNNFVNENLLLVNELIATQVYNLSLNKDRNYQWRVRAENSTEQSKWSAINGFILDTSSPNAVNLISPTQNQQVISPVVLRWNTITDAVQYELVLYKSDGVTLYNSNFPLITNTTTYNFSSTNFNELVFWKVRARDRADNWGAYSTLQNFTIQ
jgi:uncharacterized protein YegP (UPF0339 family)